jgi:hypothetical protein
MPMNEQTKRKLLEYQRKALKDSVAFFSPRSKGAIERWAFPEFLANLAGC